MCFCETNPPVKGRYMNGLEMRGLGFGKVIRGGSAFAKATARLTAGRGSGGLYMFLRNEPTDFFLENSSYPTELQ